ncbi:hypothetical protein LJB85_00165 [Porphyromonadaceae bacterium OttesenSCG-928-L07]|nr:hypothetical protein [Porphyromonadaceae bacterium OttesenSCG-928-L07]MDL2251673.1 hypothetical protein [Odoribacter sp. OttesenSCG-928-J03]MDL2330990.1 hypothetical protein [Odoribacter sp. OttesenSCG-928-A06]
MGRLFERRDPGKFQYKPRFWNPEQEEREKRERRVREELNIQGEGYVPNIEGTFREMYQKRREARKAFNGRYAVRMFLILIMVLLAGFYLMSKYGEKLVSTFM